MFPITALFLQSLLEMDAGGSGEEGENCVYRVATPPFPLNEFPTPLRVLDEGLMSTPLQDLFPQVADALDDMQTLSFPMENALAMSQEAALPSAVATDVILSADPSSPPKKKRTRKTREGGSKAARRKGPSAKKRRKRLIDDEAADGESDGDDDTRSVDEDSVGSLAEFVVEDETELQREILESRVKQREADPLDDIDPSNIITGKRQRKKPTRYIDPNYWQLMTQDMDEEEVQEFEKEVETEDKDPPVDAPDEEDGEFQIPEGEGEEETESDDARDKTPSEEQSPSEEEDDD